MLTLLCYREVGIPESQAAVCIKQAVVSCMPQLVPNDVVRVVRAVKAGTRTKEPRHVGPR